MKKTIIMILPALLVLILIALYLDAGNGAATDAVANEGQISGFDTAFADEMDQISDSFQRIRLTLIAIFAFVILYSVGLLMGLLIVVRKRRVKMKKISAAAKQVPKPVYADTGLSRRPDLRVAVKAESAYIGKERGDTIAVNIPAMQGHEGPEPQDDLSNADLEYIEAGAVMDIEPDEEPDAETGALFAEALRYVTGADIAFINSGGIRGPVHCGHTTEAALTEVFPFDDTVTVQGLTAAQIKEVLEHSAGTLPKQDGRRLHASGVTVELDAAMPAGERVTSITLSGGESLHDGTEYIVAMNDYIANGGDGYDLLAGLPKMSEGQTVVQAVLEYRTEAGIERIAV